MRLLIGFLGGLVTGITVLAIWNRTPRPAEHYSGRPNYEDSTAGGIHHPGCHWPDRPCLCDIVPVPSGKRSYA